MKRIFTLVILCVVSLTGYQAYSSSLANDRFSNIDGNAGKNKEISVGSDRKTGGMQLHFAASKAGEAVITVVDQSGKTVLEQTSTVTNSNNIIPLKKAMELSEGAYTVNLVSNNETYTTRFMIWK